MYPHALALDSSCLLVYGQDQPVKFPYNNNHFVKVLPKPS